MFKFTKKQICAFEQAALNTFFLEASQHLRRVLPMFVGPLDTEQLLLSVQQRTEYALAYGVTDRLDMLRYLECSYMLQWSDQGPDSDVRALLERNDISAEKKVDLIEQRTELL